MSRYTDCIDKALRQVQLAREDYIQRFEDDFDFDWCRDRFDAALNLLDLLRTFDEPRRENDDES